MPLRDSPAALLALMQLIGCAGDKQPGLTERSSRAVAAYPSESISTSRTRTHPAGTLVATTLAGGRPFGIAVSRNGIVYCTLLDAASLVRTTLAPGSPSILGVGSIPTDVAFSPAGTWAYVTNQHAGTIGVVDARSQKQVDAVAVPGDPFRVIVGPEGQVVYATTNAGSLVRISSETRTVSWAIQLGGNLNGLAINLEGTRVYVGDVGGQVYEVTPSGDVVRTLAVPGQPQGLALSSGGRELYVAGEAGYLIVLDLERWVEVTRTSLGAGAFGIAVTPDQAQIWVTAPHAGKVFVLDRISRTIVNTIVLGGIPRRLAFDESGSTAVIADEAGAVRFLR